ncbi:MAG: hypothetical protein PHX34_05820 [Candidatus Shapirobacteria bacterium]|nr:hypothetical protein [Candidatus Shapirobacteria bacterium]
MKRKILSIALTLVVFLSCMPTVSACHWIVGRVDDSTDGVSANDRTVMIYPFGYKEKYNMIGIIGKNGDSKTDNYFMFDIEQLCPVNIEKAIGVVIIAEVIDNGDGYKAPLTYTILTGNGFDETIPIELRKY